MKRIILYLAILCAVSASVSAWHSWKKSREHTAICVKTTADISRLTHRLAELQTKNAAAESVAADVVQNAPAIAPQNTTSLSKKFEAEATRVREAYQNQLYRDPKLQVLYQEKERARIRAGYGMLFRKLSLTPEEQAALVQAQVENAMIRQDLKALAREKGLPDNDPGLKAQRAEAGAKLMNQIAAIMGPDGLTVLRNYNHTEGARKYVASFASLFFGIGQPLALDQAESLVNAIAEEITPSNALGRLEKATPEQWDKISARAQKILTPEQWNYFKNTTPPGQSVGRWPNALEEMLTKIAGPGP